MELEYPYFDLGSLNSVVSIGGHRCAPAASISIPAIYNALVTLIAARLRETDAVVAIGRFRPLRGRVACTLLELAKDLGPGVRSGRVVGRQKIGQSDLAAMADIALVNVSRILNDRKPG